MQPYNILVVEDDASMQKIIVTMLSRSGYQVTVASNGHEALTRISEFFPDLIISDIMMPDMDGISLLDNLRSHDSTRSIPLILVTAKATTANIIEGMQLGADDYLVKPFVMSELLARVRSKLERPPVPSDLLPRDRQTGLLTERLFQDELDREFQRSKRSGVDGCLVYLSLVEWGSLREKVGPHAEVQVAKQLASLLTVDLRSLDLVGRSGASNFCILLPETSPKAAQKHLEALSQRIVRHDFIAAGEHLRLTPAFGFSTFADGQTVKELKDHALSALEVAASHIDLYPKRYTLEMAEKSKARPAAHQITWRSRLRYLQSQLNLPWQIALTVMIGMVVPYFIYTWFDSIGYDISQAVYIIIVVSLSLTALLIWVEGFLSLKKTNPSDELKIPYPPASAIIAAYLPNEALTVVETVEAFLRIEYPADFQIILAYNTPADLPVESTLREIARRDPRFTPLRIQNSTSKAQNVNAALAEVRGEFVGVFDADHHPMRESFTRAWRWLAQGFGVVQGHCVVRNGGISRISQTVAIEFELIYGSSHPGRMRLYQFGIFGGSNGYWRTDLLRETRMRSFMLTEDIDSSIRVIEKGARILSDPQLLSRELAPATLSALWNQRMRWAQGWHQVSIRHFWKAIRSRRFSLRQKIGFFWLLAWREFYPWISIQIFPLVAYWVVKYGGLDKLDWLIPIFVLTTLFTLSVGPGQAVFSYLVSVPEIKKHKSWFFFYFVVTSLAYSEFKNLISRVAQIKEILHEREWRVTPRVK